MKIRSPSCTEKELSKQTKIKETKYISLKYYPLKWTKIDQGALLPGGVYLACPLGPTPSMSISSIPSSQAGEAAPSL